MRARHLLQVLTGNAVLQAVGLATGIIVARALGAEQRGQLATITLYPLLCVNMGIIGLDQAVALAICRQRDHINVIAASGAAVATVLGLGVGLTTYAALPYLLGPARHGLVGEARLFTIVVPAGVLMITLLGVDWGQSAYKSLVVLRIVQPVFYFAALIVLVATGRLTVHSAMVALIASVFVASAVRLVLLRDTLFAARPDVVVCKELLRTGSGMYVATMAGMVTQRADQMLVSRLLSDADMGLYVVAGNVAISILGVANAFSTVGFAATGDQQQPKGARDVMVSQFRFAMLALLLSAICLAGVVRPAIRVLFGSGFAGAAGPAVLLIAASVGLGLTKVVQESLKAMRQWQAATLSEVLALVLVLALGAALVPRWGLHGAALAHTAARWLSLIWVTAWSCRTLGIPPRDLWGLNWGTLRSAALAVLGPLSAKR